MTNFPDFKGAERHADLAQERVSIERVVACFQESPREDLPRRVHARIARYQRKLN